MTGSSRGDGLRRGSIALGRLIERRRSDLALGQAAFARRIGVSQQTVSRWERGESMPQRTHLYDLADALDLDLELLLDGSHLEPAPGRPVDDPAALGELAAAVEEAIRALLRVQAALDAVSDRPADDELVDLLTAAPRPSVAEDRAALRAAARRLTAQARTYREEAAQQRRRADERRRQGV